MNLTKFNLLGRNALITGAAGMLGIQHALALLACQANVIMTDTDAVALNSACSRLKLEHPKAKILSFQMDVTNEDNVRAVLDDCKAKGISINILINNAAVDSKVGDTCTMSNSSRFEEFGFEEWDRQLRVGLSGAFICSKIFGYAMAENEGGVILNISSDLSVIAPDQRLYSDHLTEERFRDTKPVTYSVIKHGLIGLTKYISTYWPDKNVRCNALSPGGVFADQNANFIDKIQDRIPLGRMAHVDEYRSAVQFLCSDASSYLTGHNLVIDGGRSIW